MDKPCQCHHNKQEHKCQQEQQAEQVSQQHCTGVLGIIKSPTGRRRTTIATMSHQIRRTTTNQQQQK